MVRSKILHKSFVWKCQDCVNGCNYWYIRDKACGRWGGAQGHLNALKVAESHFLNELWAGVSRVLSGK